MGTLGSKSSKKDKPEKVSKKKDKGSKISIVLSTLQTLVLLLFNEQVAGQKVTLTLKDISTAIKVDAKDLKKYLKSLALKGEDSAEVGRRQGYQPRRCVRG